MDAQTLTLTHRPATLDDLAQIADFPQNMDELFFSYPRAVWPLDTDQLQTGLAQCRDSTLVLLDDQPAGFACFHHWRHGKHCQLGNLIVAPWARGRGVAHYLFETMAEHARAHYQARLLNASCLNTNTAALRLGMRLGFQVQALEERQDHCEQRVVLVHLQKQLRQASAWQHAG